MVSGAAAAGGGVSRVACEKRGEGAVWKRPKAQLSWPIRPNSPSPNPPHGHGIPPPGALQSVPPPRPPPLAIAASLVARRWPAAACSGPPLRLRPAVCRLQTCHLRAAGCGATCSRGAALRSHAAGEPLSHGAADLRPALRT
ncbi:hypothetical protein PVAP13_1NG175057 [Panicum virgatum]|uniref:Uncharacterized protein n=1 Tax=Panicum virgatum TaxID=38727 RepID=A0A8T0WRU4_PANVG|nr:hypothetical protein PVAP13_1NG175057 [Panicum virgatum]